MSKLYEGMFIIRSQSALEGNDGVLTKLQETISKHGGTIESSQNLGKKRLAYRIKNCAEGAYWLTNFRISPDSINKLKSAFNLNDAVLRVLIIAK